jgi:hypothetical protein
MVAAEEEVRPSLRRHDWHRDDCHLSALGVARARFAGGFPLAPPIRPRTQASTPALDIPHPPSRVPGRCRQLRPCPRCHCLQLAGLQLDATPGQTLRCPNLRLSKSTKPCRAPP